MVKAGVVNGLPVNNSVPPVAALYQLKVTPATAWATKVAVEPEHIFCVGALTTGATGDDTTLTVAGVRTAWVHPSAVRLASA